MMKKLQKQKGVYKKIRHKEFADVFFNRKVIRHNMKRIHEKVNCIGLELMIKGIY